MFAEVKNGAVVNFPYDHNTLAQRNPYTKFSETNLLLMYAGTEDNVSGNELVGVTDADAPVINTQIQKVIKNSTPTLVSGVWTLTWSVQALTQAEQDVQNADQASLVRQARNDKLKDSDWTQITDSTADKTAWAVYRMSLRDITEQDGFPWAVTWPTPPAN